MYSPKPAPFDPKALPQYVADELQSVAQAQRDPVDFIQLNVLHVAPKKPRDGMVVMFDGTDVNPGSGAGVYCYRAAAWRFLG